MAVGICTIHFHLKRICTQINESQIMNRTMVDNSMNKTYSPVLDRSGESETNDSVSVLFFLAHMFDDVDEFFGAILSPRLNRCSRFSMLCSEIG